VWPSVDTRAFRKSCFILHQSSATKKANRITGLILVRNYQLLHTKHDDRSLANARLAVCGAIRLSLVYLAPTKNALPFEIRAANWEPRPAILVLEREADWSSDSVAQPMADLNARDGTLYRKRFWVWPPLF
jgi:hypothetical protein